MSNKRAWKVVSRILEILLLIAAAAVLLLHSPRVQTRLVNKITSALQNSLRAKISFSDIRMIPFNTLVIENVTLVESEPLTPMDTILSARKLSLSCSLKELLNVTKPFDGGACIRRVRAQDLQFNLVMFDPDEDGNNLNLNRAFRAHIDENANPEDIRDLFTIGRVELKRGRFRLRNYASDIPAYNGHGLNWSDLDLDIPYASIRSLKHVDSRLSMEILRLRATDKCGYTLNAHGRMSAGMGFVEVLDAHLWDDWSNLDIASYTMTYARAKDFSDYVNAVSMGLDARPSKLAMKTISAYAGTFYDCPLVLDISSLSGRGPVNNLRIKDLTFTERCSGVSADLDFSMKNIIPDGDKPHIEAEIRKLDFTTKGLQTAIDGLINDNSSDLSRYAKGVNASFEGNASGWIDQLAAEGKLSTDCGEISIDATTRSTDKGNGAFTFNGWAKLKELNLGKILGIETLGETSMQLVADGEYDNGLNKVQVDTFNISGLVFDNYLYHDIKGKGHYENNLIEGNIISGDPNAGFAFQGRLDTSGNEYKADGKLSILNFDLEKTKIDRRGGGSRVKGEIDIRATTDSSGNIYGSLKGRDLMYATDMQDGLIGDFSLDFFDSASDHEAKSTTHIMRLTSPVFGRVEFRSSLPVTKIPAFIKGALLNRYMPALTTEQYRAEDWQDHSFILDIDLEDTRGLLLPLKSDIYISSGSSADLRLRKGGKLNFDFDSEVIRVGDFRFKTIQLAADNYNGPVRLRSVTPAQINSEGFNVSEMELSASLVPDSLSLSGRALSDKLPSLSLQCGARAYRDGEGGLCFKGKMGDSSIGFADKTWHFTHGTADYKTRGDLNISKLGLYCEAQSLNLDGSISRNAPAEMKLHLQSFDLGVLRTFVSQLEELDFNGQLSGEASYMTPLGENAGLNIDLYTDELKLAGGNFGSFEVQAMYDDEDEKIHFGLTHRSPEGIEDLKIRKEESSLDIISSAKSLRATILFNSLDPEMFTPFVRDYIAFESGSIDGKVYVDYDFTNEKLSIDKSYLNISDALTIIPTGVRYDIGGRLLASNDKLKLQRLVISDSYGGEADIKSADDGLEATLRSLKVLSPQGQGEILNGNLALSGALSLSHGKQGELLLNSALRTAGAGNLSVFLAEIGKSESSTVIYLKPEADEDDFVHEGERAYMKEREAIKKREEELRELRSRNSSRFIAQVSLTTDPQVRLGADLSGGGDISLTVDGGGTVDIGYDSDNEGITLGGDYTIEDGDFLLSAAGLINKSFDIENGSSLRFSGDVMNTDLNITASNTVKATIGTLISDTTSVSSRRDVICRLSVTGKISNPQLAFGIDIPDLDPTTETLVRSELNTEDKVQKQFLALIATGSFLPSAQSGITNTLGSSFILSNLSSLASGQITSMLRNAGIPLDVGVGYTQNEEGKDIVDLNVSTQFFGNRVVVSGSLGNRKYSTTSSDNVVGDIDIEVKLDKSGQLRTKLFSHSADDYTNYLDNTQRSGAGISYQKEFNTFGEFFRSLLRKRSDDELIRQAESRAKLKTLKIEAPSSQDNSSL